MLRYVAGIRKEVYGADVISNIYRTYVCHNSVPATYVCISILLIKPIRNLQSYILYSRFFLSNVCELCKKLYIGLQISNALTLVCCISLAWALREIRRYSITLTDIIAGYKNPCFTKIVPRIFCLLYNSYSMEIFYGILPYNI